MKNLIKIAKKISILVLVVSLFGCTDDDDNKYPVLEAGFTYTINIDTGTVTFINISSQATNYSWDFGDDTSSNLINPVKTYPNGTYTVILRATNVAGASDTFEDEITILIPEKATLPISFDGENTNYDAEVFGGAEFEVVDNPDPSGSNPTVTKVGAVTNSGAAFEGFYFDLGAPINLTTNKSISMNFWSDEPISVLLKLEEGTGAAIEATASHGGTGWETIIFNFSSSNSYSRFTMFVDGPGTTAGTFYVDDITQIETPPLPCTAETAESLNAADFNLTFQTDQTANITADNATFAWISNPDFDNTVNPSCKVAEYVRNPDELYPNHQINFTSPLSFVDNAGFKLKVWSPTAGTNVTVKLEGGVVKEVTKPTTTASAWEELTFDFGDNVTGNTKIVLFFNVGTNTPGTFYYDDFKLYPRSGGGACTVETTESLNVSDFNLTFQTDQTAKITPDNATFAWITNPDFDNAVNPSCKVGEYVRNPNELYPNHQINFTSPLSFVGNAGFKLKVWTPTVGTNVTVKLEGGVVKEVTKPTTKASEWEELTFDFDGSVTGNTKIVLFFNVGTNTPGTFYYDDFKLYPRDGGGNPPGDCPAPPAGELLSNGDFEAGESCWQFFAGTSISTTVNNGGSNSAEMQGATGVAVNFKQERFAIGVVQPNTSYTVSFDIIANGPFGDGGVFKAFAFSEGADGGSVPATLHTLTDNTTSLATTWERKTYTFTTAPNANQVEGGLSFLLEIVNSSAKLNVDNVVIKKTP
jgi:hypothetical protein